MKPPFFLHTITVENFKAVHRSGAVKLTPLTVFIGDNGSGKSSLIEGLETYQEVVIRGLDAAMERWLGFEHVWNKRVRHHRKNIGTEDETHENPMVFALKGRVIEGSFGVCMEISADPGIGGVRIKASQSSSQTAAWCNVTAMARRALLVNPNPHGKNSITSLNLQHLVISPKSSRAGSFSLSILDVWACQRVRY